MAPQQSEADLVPRFLTSLRLFALRRLGDPAEAEDVAQETLKRVIAALRANRLLDQAALPAFLYETAAHVCQHRLRKLGRQGRAHERLASQESTAVEAAALARLLGREQRREVRSALAALGPGDGELLRRLYFEDEAPSAVARSLGIQEGALRVRRHRALRRLRRILEERNAASDSRAASVTWIAQREPKW